MERQYKEAKDCIENYLRIGEIEQAVNLLDIYECMGKDDADFITLRVVSCFTTGQVEKAEQLSIDTLKKIRFHFNLEYNLICIYQVQKRYEEAFNVCEQLLERGYEEDKQDLVIDKISELLEQIYAQTQDVAVLEYYNVRIKQIGQKKLYRHFPYMEDACLVGRCIDDRFIGIYDRMGCEKGIKIEEYTGTVMPIEIYQVDPEIRFYTEECMVPIVSKEAKTLIKIKTKDSEESFEINAKNRYHYFKLNKGDMIIRNDQVICGKPIPLKKNKNLKDLVLVLFIDGLSQKVLQGQEMNLMPNTYRFFNKGTVCENAYVSGEWTYVGVASYMTGMYTAKHNMFHPNLNIELPVDRALLTETFQRAGYMTAKIDGDWRSCFPHGYGRGVDRVIYEPTLVNMYTRDIIPELIEHMEAFKDTNQFIWTCLPDLHDVADGYHAPISIQLQEELSKKVSNRKYEKGKTSVQQFYNEDKIESYKRQIKRIDMYLAMLYNYIESNFDMERVTVALISDHGQGYLVKEHEHMMSEGRVKVPFMFRSIETKDRVVPEYIQGLDLMSILYKLSGIKTDTNGLDTHLPKAFGGVDEREYVYSESIFPEAPYRAAIHMKDYGIYFETYNTVTLEGRVELHPYTINIKDLRTGEIVENIELEQKGKSIVFEHMKAHAIYT